MQHAKYCQPVKSHWAAAVHTYLCAARLCHLAGLKEMLIFPCRIRSWIQSLFLPLSSHSFYHSFFPPFLCSHMPKATATSWQTLEASQSKALLEPQQISPASTGVGQGVRTLAADYGTSLSLKTSCLAAKTCFMWRSASSHYGTPD